MNSNVIRIVSIVLFIISLFFNAFCCYSCTPGYWALLIGWLGLVANGANYAWLANPIVFVLWTFLYRNLKASLVLSILATCLAFLPFSLGEIAVDEAGTPRTIISFGLGYWLWLLSIIIMCIRSLYLFEKK